MVNDRLIEHVLSKQQRQCIHCGMCLSACPTYAILRTEMDSPRGRIAMIGGVSQGKIDLLGVVQAHLDLCLVCRACETACPSGVEYGEIVKTVRYSIERTRRRGIRERLVRWLALVVMMPNMERLKLAAKFLRVYERSGLQTVVRRADVLHGPMRVMEALLPPLPHRYSDYTQVFPAIGERRGTLALFRGCVQEAFLAGVNQATIRVLQRNGYEVHVPPGQTCCGAAHLHLGEEGMLTELARRNIAAFSGGMHTAIVSNAGGCGAVLKDYGRLLSGDPEYAEGAKVFSSRVIDVAEFLSEHLKVPPCGELHLSVTYADSCHLRHAQRVVKGPRTLLGMIPRLELRELTHPDQCCGGAGVYNILHTDMANRIMAAKVADIAMTRADVVVVANTGCHLQLLRGLREAGIGAEVVHLVELLDRSYSLDCGPGRIERHAH